MRWVILAIILGVAGCDSPSVSMLGGLVGEVEISGSRFRVFKQPGAPAVEVHRTSAEVLPSLVATFEKAYWAMELATGCKVIPGSLRGDQAIILAEMDCRAP